MLMKKLFSRNNIIIISVAISCIILAYSLLPTTIVSAAITPNRNLPGTPITPDYAFEVSVTFTAPSGSINAIGLSDFAPSGWIVAVDPDWCSPAPFGSLASANRADFIWDGPYESGQVFTATYRVTVPLNTKSGTYNFHGVIEYYLADNGPFTDSVDGQTQVTVTSYSGGSTNIEPIADAGGPYTGTIDTPVAFDGAGSIDPDGAIVSYDWNFGDSTTGDGLISSHVYTIRGTYTVSLTVTDNKGLTDSDTAMVTIEGKTLTSETTQPEDTPAPTDDQDDSETFGNNGSMTTMKDYTVQINPAKDGGTKSESFEYEGSGINWWIVTGIAIGSIIALFLLVKLVLSLRRY